MTTERNGALRMRRDTLKRDLLALERGDGGSRHTQEEADFYRVRLRAVNGELARLGARTGKRIRSGTVTFNRRFVAPKMKHELSGGAYFTETDEEMLEGVSTSSYLRTEVRLFVPGREGVSDAETCVLSPSEFDQLVSCDRLPVLPTQYEGQFCALKFPVADPV